MALKNHSPEDLRHFEDELQEVASEVRKIRQKMEADEISEVKLESAKAGLFLEYLREWAVKCAGRYEQEKIRQIRRDVVGQKGPKKKS